MTAGFVLVLTPCLLIISAHLPDVVTRASEIKESRQVGWIAERVTESLTRAEWQAGLSEVVEKKLPKENHVALLLVDRDGRLVWRSPGPGPAWPSAWVEDWLRGLRPKEERAAAEMADRAAPAGERHYRASVGPADAKAEHLRLEIEVKTRAESEATGKQPAEVRKPDDDWRMVARFAVGPKERRLLLIVAQDWSAVLQDRAAQKRELTLLSLCAVLGEAAGTWVLVGRTLSPIRRLALQAGAASVENLQVRLKAPSQDAEVVELVDTLNGLLARLAETAAVKGRFYAAASHELRTPLQALSGHLEVSLSRGRTAEAYETFLQEASRQTGRLTSLVKGLLLLHQLDSPAARPREPVDLAEVCDDALGQLAPLIDARGLQIRADRVSGAEIMAVPTHAEILVRNLVENAVKYASPGGEVTLCLTAAGRARLEVFNECPPVLDGDPQKLFEPFYRPDTARNARTGGNGLGLAICRAIAAANGWTVTLQQEPRGVRAAVTFGEARAAREAGLGS